MVSDAGASYNCILAVTGSTVPGSDPTHWDIVAAKGAPGPDNITTSTTTNGTGFLKGNGSVISFDNSTYETTSALGTWAGTSYITTLGTITTGTLDSIVAKGTWTASGTWTIPAVTLGGTLDVNSKSVINAAGITFDATKGIHSAVNNSYTVLTGGLNAAGGGALVTLAGIAAGDTGAFYLDTPNAAGNGDIIRLSVSGKTATSVATWSNITHTGLVLSGALNANSQNIISVAALGVGTAGPRATLEVVSGVANTDADPSKQLTVVGPNIAMGSMAGNLQIATNDAAAADMGGSISFGARYSGTAQANFAVIKAGMVGSYGGYMSLATRADLGAMTEHLRITSTGLLSITAGDKINFIGSFAEPAAYETASTGDKIILYEDAGGYDGRIGVGNASDMWFKSSGPAAGTGLFRFFVGSTPTNIFEVASTGITTSGTVTASTFISVIKNQSQPVRAFTTVYHNTGLTPLWVTVSITTSAGAPPQYVYAVTDASATPATVVARSGLVSVVNATVSEFHTLTFVVLPGNYYELFKGGSPTIDYWTEWY
jgi:hypothetical protein